MVRKRRNINLEDEVKSKIHDVQYRERQDNNRAGQLSISEIINRVFQALSIKQIIGLIKKPKN